MTITFIKYDQVVERVAIGVDDGKNGFRRMDFTMEAIEDIIEKNDPSYSNLFKQIRLAINDRGGMIWINKEIAKYQKAVVEGTEDMVRENY